MGYTYGEMSYKYNLEIDLSYLVELILEQIEGADDCEFDGDTLMIYGSTSNRAKAYYSPPTLYDPPEYDMEFTEATIDELDFEKIVMDACSKYKDFIANRNPISKCELDEKSFSFEPDEDYGPDPDRAYDEWKDRQLFGD